MPGDQINAFTMVTVGNYLMISRIATTQDATPVGGIAPSDWEKLAVSDGDISGCTREIVCRGTDVTSQNPVGTDNPMQVKFGPAVNTGTDPVNIDDSGNIFINQTDNYHFRLSSQYGRSGSGGTAWLWQRVLVNGAQAGVSVLAKLNNSGSDFPYQAELTAILPAGVVVTVELWRDSTGADDGGFIYEEPTLAGANAGYSADIIVSRYVLT